MDQVRRFFVFPDPVNEVAARAVAAGVATLAATILLSRAWVLLWPLAYGFVARVSAGPRLSPLGRIAVHLVAPRFEPRPVAGPPKRFAQGIGAVVTTGALAAHYLVGADGVVLVLLGAMVIFATLEAGFGLCVGCRIFAGLQRAGWVSAVCETCEVPRSAQRLSPGV